MKKVIKNLANGAYAPIKNKLKLYYRPKQYVKKWGRKIGMKLYNDFFNYKTEGELTQFEIPEYPYAISLRKGTSDEPTFRQVFMNVRYDFDLGYEPQTIIDGGANVGYASVFFAQKYPEAKILAVEPDSSNFDLIKSNTEKYDNIYPIQSAIWGTTAKLKIINPDFEKWAFQVAETEESNPNGFQAYSVKDLLEQMNWQSVDLLKLDIEGAESSVFEKGYEEWLPHVKTLIIELHEKMKPGCTVVFEKAISRFNFEASISGENLIYRNLDK